jgi:hypothetical protein
VGELVPGALETRGELAGGIGLPVRGMGLAGVVDPPGPGPGTDGESGIDFGGAEDGMALADGPAAGRASVANKLSRYSSLTIRSPNSMLLRLINLVVKDGPGTCLSASLETWQRIIIKTNNC